jgi:hypothetical protein
MAWNLFGAIHQVGAALKTSPTASINDAVQLRLPRSGTCTIATVSGPCVVHTCQATVGASGAALLSPADDGSLQVVGIHLAGADGFSDRRYAGQCDVAAFQVPANFYPEGSSFYAGNLGRVLTVPGGNQQ